MEKKKKVDFFFFLFFFLQIELSFFFFKCFFFWENKICFSFFSICSVNSLSRWNRRGPLRIRTSAWSRQSRWTWGPQTAPAPPWACWSRARSSRSPFSTVGKKDTRERRVGALKLNITFFCRRQSRYNYNQHQFLTVTSSNSSFTPAISQYIHVFKIRANPLKRRLTPLTLTIEEFAFLQSCSTLQTQLRRSLTSLSYHITLVSFVSRHRSSKTCLMQCNLTLEWIPIDSILFADNSQMCYNHPETRPQTSPRLTAQPSTTARM